MMLPNAGRLPRRAFLIYIVAIVGPACGLLWLGIQSFERQRYALAALTAEKIDVEVAARTRAAAERAFLDPSHPIATHFFTLEHGIVTRPALHAPPPHAVPAGFAEAEEQELTLNRPELALASYRALLAQKASRSLALSRIARCLSKLGRDSEARAAWRQLASSFPDERDLFHRPYGITAAINAGDTDGLYDQITAGRWELAADQAEYFLTTLDPQRRSPYLDRFRFARELTDDFKIPGALRPQQIYSYALGARQLLYRAAGTDVIEGFAVNPVWVADLRTGLERELGATRIARQGLLFHGGSIAVVLLILSAGVALLVRDVSREARTNQLRSNFVSGVTHELKTPITVMRLYGETLLRHPEFPAEERRDFYRIIARESTRLGRLVDQILTFSRVERGDERYEMKDGDLAAVIARLTADYSEWLEHAGFSVHQDLPSGLPRVCFDEAAVSQAVLNLLDNAAKYSGTSREIDVRLAAQNGDVIFEVEDRGVGISRDEQAKVFDEFYRVPNGSGKGGYGLGLFMVRHIMEAHGGRAEVDSEPGRGSRFRLLFPVSREAS